MASKRRPTQRPVLLRGGGVIPAGWKPEQPYSRDHHRASARGIAALSTTAASLPQRGGIGSLLNR